MEARCENCGKMFYVKPSRIKRLKTDMGACCSVECSASLKAKHYMGESNPNYRYAKSLDFIYDLTHDGAYVLGLIYSDGHVKETTVEIYQDNVRSGYLLSRISNIIYGEDIVKHLRDDVHVLTINDKALVEFLLGLGGINVGRKSEFVGLPKILSEDKLWSFLAGYFDGDGGFKYNYRYPEISVTSNSSGILSDIAEMWGVNYNGKNKIYASGKKALDICGKMYANVSLKHTKKYTYFMDILNWSPLPSGKWYHTNHFKWKRFDKKSMAPQKKRVTDSGYDIFAASIEYDEATDLYVADTKIAVEPLPGWYFDMVGRSSLPKSGFMFVGG
ncbi:MAG: hypothetical protein DRI46_10600, partial [Chloroflexi bacterium]